MLAIIALAPGFASKPLPLDQDRKEITCADVLAAGFCEFDASHVCAKTCDGGDSDLPLTDAQQDIVSDFLAHKKHAPDQRARLLQDSRANDATCDKTAGFNGIPTAAVGDECCSGCASDEICMGGTPGTGWLSGPAYCIKYDDCAAIYGHYGEEHLSFMCRPPGKTPRYCPGFDGSSEMAHNPAIMSPTAIIGAREYGECRGMPYRMQHFNFDARVDAFDFYFPIPTHYHDGRAVSDYWRNQAVQLYCNWFCLLGQQRSVMPPGFLETHGLGAQFCAELNVMGDTCRMQTMVDDGDCDDAQQLTLPAEAPILSCPCANRPVFNLPHAYSNYTSECVTDDTNLNRLREASLKCIASYAHTHPSFGTVDGSYREYDGDGICLGVGGDIHRDQGFRRTFLTAEPLNAESNFAFDVLACHSSSFVHKAASLLAIGSFAMHASGDDGQDSWMGKLDVAPMRCSVAAMLAEAIERTSGDTTVTVPNGGPTYVFDATMKNCADPIADAVTECNLDESSSTNLGAQLDEAIAATPRLQLSIGLLAGGLLNACYGSAAAIINSQGDELGMTADEQAAAIAFQFGDALTPSSPACAEGLSTMFEFIDAAKYQENVVDGVCATQNCHHIWHMKTALAFESLLDVIDLFPGSGRRLDDARRLEDETHDDAGCPAGCDADGQDSDARQRRSLLFASRPEVPASRPEVPDAPSGVDVPPEIQAALDEINGKPDCSGCAAREARASAVKPRLHTGPQDDYETAKAKLETYLDENDPVWRKRA